MLIVCTILYNGLVILQHSCSVVEDSRIFARADAVGCSAPEAGVSNRSKSDSPTNTRPKREGEAGSPERTENSRMKSADSLLTVSCETHGRACCFTLASICATRHLFAPPACRAAQALKVSKDAVKKSREQLDDGQDAAEQ
jgi:hypothetical protein